MNVFEQVKQPAASILSSPIALILIISTLLWATGAPLLMNRVEAGQVTNFSDTLNDSDLGVATKHTIRFTSTTTVPALGTINFVFDAAGDRFTFSGNASTTANFAGSSGLTVTDSCSGAANEVTPSYSNTAGAEGLTFTVCTGDTVPAGAITIVVGTTTPLITNPSSAGSYIITMTTSAGDFGTTRVATIDDVVVTASVDTTFTFSISGMATSSVVNGETLTGYSSSTYLAFGSLTPGVEVTLGQRLNVTTNAANGYSVTVVQDGNLRSSTGADIDLFRDGSEVATAEAWGANPLNTLGSENTYGHIGLTSDDNAVLGGDLFGTQLFVGNFATPRQVMYHNAPADGTTAGIGSTTVAFKLEIGSLQEAGTDYTNTLTYVATPVF